MASQPPPRHAVILYGGREGSSAIVSHLARHPQVVVPVFEDLDLYRVEHAVPAPARIHLAQALRRTLRSGHYAPEAFAPAGTGWPAPDPAGRQTIFKWRAWGLDDAVAAALAAEGAGLVALNRRDLLNLNLSLYMARHVIGDGTLRHPQFEVFDMPAPERAAFRAELRAMRFDVDPAELLAWMTEQVAAKRDMLGALSGLPARGVPVRPLWYEDFVADPVACLAGLLDWLGLPWDAAARHGDYVKVNRAEMRAQVDNLAALEADPGIRDVLRAWEEVVGAYAVLG